MSTTLRDPREVIREEMAMHQPILEAVADEPLTVPRLAERIGRPSSEIVYWVMGMRRYGLLVESSEPDEDGYFSYAAPRQAGGDR